MARARVPALPDRLLDALLWLLQLLADVWAAACGAARALVDGRPARARRSAKARGARPEPPSTVGLVFAEPLPDDVSVQQAANLAVW